MHFPLMYRLQGASMSLPRGPCLVRDFTGAEFVPSLFICGSGAGEDERVDFPRLFSSWRKLRA